jgi:hypothetical protein
LKIRAPLAVPLSVVKMKSVFSATPSSRSSARVAPTLSSMLLIIPKKAAIAGS